MTSEERFIKIENALQAVSESQARHEAAIRDLIVVSRTLLESQKKTDTQIQRLSQGQQEIRDDFDRKIVELIEADRRLGIKLDALAERSAETDEKLHALIEVVDRVIRRQNGPF